MLLTRMDRKIKPMLACPRPVPGSAAIRASTIRAGRILRLTEDPPTKPASASRCPKRWRR